MIALRPDASDFKVRFGNVIASCRRPRAVLMASGREAGNLLKKHFREKDQTNVNQLAPDRRAHYWLGVSRAVQVPVVEGDTAVSITIADPTLAQKVFGGTIVAKRARDLTIPIAPDAYGRTTAVFEAETGLKLFVLHAGGTASNGKENILLAAARGQGIEVEYLLTPSVDQKADPTALPEEKQFADSILAKALEVQEHINRGEQNA